MSEFDRILKNLVQEQLAPARIIDLHSVEAEDVDGDPILRIRVVYQAKKNGLDTKKLGGLTRHLLTNHGDIFEDRHPIFSFILPEEVKYFAAN
ncbi:MAG: hypothetical protein OXF95_08700 [Rhodobacteraceae bacterium]|nr:hypothetical protein [Paracoccaceae bacterium]